jgi:5'-phosphate synthase pdxT subunit
VSHPRIGVLALQGDVREHLAATEACGAAALPVRLPAELAGVDGLVLPGGESTTMSRLLRVFGLEAPLRERLEEGMPALGTCAGLILLARTVLDGRSDQRSYGIFDVAVRRNAYGRQVESFEREVPVTPLGVAPFPGVFIRAPRIEEVGPEVEVIARLDGEPVGVSQGPNLGLSFHPEMTGDLRLHRLFVDRVSAALAESAA